MCVYGGMTCHRHLPCLCSVFCRHHCRYRRSSCNRPRVHRSLIGCETGQALSFIALCSDPSCMVDCATDPASSVFTRSTRMVTLPYVKPLSCTAKRSSLPLNVNCKLDFVVTGSRLTVSKRARKSTIDWLQKASPSLSQSPRNNGLADSQ